MSNSTPTHSPKLISERKKKKQREKRIKRSDLLSTPREREREIGKDRG